MTDRTTQDDATSEDGWVSVEDRLPPSHSPEKILCAHERDGFMYTSTCSARNFDPADLWTHWRYIPPLPSEAPDRHEGDDGG